jgi:hypothetical protein
VGIYLLEAGANQRSSVVVYDRDGSSISLTPPEDYAFEKALAGVTWVHLTGITPAIGEAAFKSTLALAKLALLRFQRGDIDDDTLHGAFGFGMGREFATLFCHQFHIVFSVLGVVGCWFRESGGGGCS